MRSITSLGRRSSSARRSTAALLRTEAFVGRLDGLELLLCAAGVRMRCLALRRYAARTACGHRAFEPKALGVCRSSLPDVKQ